MAGGGYITPDYIITNNGVTDINDIFTAVNIPVSEGIMSVNVGVKLENTLDIYQLCVISQGESELFTAAVKDYEDLCFPVKIKNGIISFEMLLAQVKSDVLQRHGSF